MLGRALGTSLQKRPPGQACHVGQIRLSDWLKFEMLPSDWLGAKPTPCTTPTISEIYRKKSITLQRSARKNCFYLGSVCTASSRNTLALNIP